MELKHILGRTWAAEDATALLPVYFLTDRDIVLIDTGYAKLARTDPPHRRQRPAPAGRHLLPRPF